MVGVAQVGRYGTQEKAADRILIAQKFGWEVLASGIRPRVGTGLLPQSYLMISRLSEQSFSEPALRFNLGERGRGGKRRETTMGGKQKGG